MVGKGAREKRMAYFSKAKDEEIPLYRKVNDRLLIVGVKHDLPGAAERGCEKVRHFMKEVEGLDHLALEGMGSTHENSRGVFGENYEHIALKHFKGKPRFLEEGMPADYPATLQKHGFSLEMYAIMVMTDVVRMSLVRDPDTHGWEAGIACNRSIIEGIARAKEVSPVLKNVSGADLMLISPMPSSVAMMEVRGLAGGYLRAQLEFTLWVGWLNDHELYAPRIREMLAGTSGKAGAVLGIGHADYQAELLSAGHGKKAGVELPSWPDFVAGLDAETRAAIEFISNGFR